MGKGGGGFTGGAGCPVRSEGRREGELDGIALGYQGIVIVNCQDYQLVKTVAGREKDGFIG